MGKLRLMGWAGRGFEPGTENFLQGTFSPQLHALAEQPRFSLPFPSARSRRPWSLSFQKQSLPSLTSPADQAMKARLSGRLTNRSPHSEPEA